MQKSTDFHFRLTPDLRARLGKAREAIKVKGDRRRLTDLPTVSDLVVAFLELGLDKLEAGLPVVDAPSLRAKSARQIVPKSQGGGFILAPLYSPPIYEAVRDEPRPLGPEESSLFDLDSRHIEPGEKVFVRGLIFTRSRKTDIIGELVTVLSVGRKLVKVKHGPRQVTLHVYDLVADPMGLPGCFGQDPRKGGQVVVPSTILVRSGEETRRVSYDQTMLLYGNVWHCSACGHGGHQADFRHSEQCAIA